MAAFSISIEAARDRAAVLKILRSYSNAPLGELSAAIGTDRAALTVEDDEIPADLDFIGAVRRQHARFLDACRRLRAAGATIRLWFQVTHDSEREEITETAARELMEAYLQQLERRL